MSKSMRNYHNTFFGGIVTLGLSGLVFLGGCDSGNQDKTLEELKLIAPGVSNPSQQEYRLNSGEKVIINTHHDFIQGGGDGYRTKLNIGDRVILQSEKYGYNARITSKLDQIFIREGEEWVKYEGEAIRDKAIWDGVWKDTIHQISCGRNAMKVSQEQALEYVRQATSQPAEKEK